MSDDNREGRQRREGGGDADGAGRKFPSSVLWVFVALGFLLLANLFFLQGTRSKMKYTEFLRPRAGWAGARPTRRRWTASGR